MSNTQHVELIKQGADIWNEWRQANPNVIPDLRFADLSGHCLTRSSKSEYPINLDYADLRGADLSYVDLECAHLSYANLSGSILRNAYLRFANLTGADLGNADLSYVNFDSEYDVDLSFITDLCEANCTNANFSFASLRDVDLRGSNLSRATFFHTRLSLSSFSQVIFNETVIVGSNLEGAHGFESCRHLGPSYIDKTTVINSKGLPLNFLRGLGVDEKFLGEGSLLVGSTSKYYSLFISHSTRDDVFARRLRIYLQDKGVRCWYAPEDLKIGAKLRTTLDHEIECHEKLLLILSENSIDSQWVEQEVEKALEKERLLKGTPGKEEYILIPIRIDNSIFEKNAGWANLLKNTRNIGDFTDWKTPDCFEQSILKLLNDIEKAK